MKKLLIASLVLLSFGCNITKTQNENVLTPTYYFDTTGKLLITEWSYFGIGDTVIVGSQLTTGVLLNKPMFLSCAVYHSNGICDGYGPNTTSTFLETIKASEIDTSDILFIKNKQ